MYLTGVALLIGYAAGCTGLLVAKRMTRSTWADIAVLFRIPLRRPALIATVFLVGWFYWEIRELIHGYRSTTKEN